MFERVGPLDFGDDEGALAQGPGGSTNGFNIRCGFHKGLAYRVHAILESEFQTRPVMLCESADTQINARQIETLFGAQFTADLDFALNIVAGNSLDNELDQTIIEKEAVAWFYDFGSGSKLIETRLALPTISSLVRVKFPPDCS